MLKQKIAIITLLLLAVTGVWAQQEPSFTHYWAMEPSFNPAAVGKQSKLNVTGAYAIYHGVGLQLVNDQIGLFSHQRLMAQYAYKLRLFGGTLSIGLQGGVLSEKFRGSGLDLENGNDPAFTKSDVNGVAIDLSTGLYYTHGPWYAGLSMLHATAPSIELGDRSIYDVARAYYLTAGYNIQLRNPLLSIHPSVLAHTDGTSHRVNVTTRLKYTHEQKMMYAGVGYSPSNSVTALIGGFFHGITIGYSYEIYTSVLKIGNGSHELFVGYQTDLIFQKKGRNRHQSVRIL